MTCRSGKTGEGTAPVVPRPGSCAQAAVEALVRFSEEERLFGAAKAYESFDGILTEHALALEEALDMLRDALGGPGDQWSLVAAAAKQVAEQINYVRALGSVAATEEEEDAK